MHLGVGWGDVHAWGGGGGGRIVHVKTNAISAATEQDQSFAL